MSGALRKFKRGRNRNLLVGKVGAKQGRRMFWSTGHATTKKAGIVIEELHRSYDLDSVAAIKVLFEEMQQQKAPEMLNALLGVSFKSKMEANYARFLEELRTGKLSSDDRVLLNWVHEPARFWFPVSRGVTSFVPDFLLIFSGRPHEWHEVKGWLDSKSATALKRFAKHFPDEHLVLIDRDRYGAIERKLGQTIEQWEFPGKE